MTDIHSHIIFGVDDGAKSMEESLDMLQAAKESSIDRIIATPHIKSADADIFQIINNYRCLAPVAGNLGIELHLGYEYNVVAIDHNDYDLTARFCISNTSVLLLEFPFDNWPANWERVIYDLQAKGLSIIIAHPERYLPVQRDLSRLDQMADLGCMFQLNAASLLKRCGNKAKAVQYIREMDKIDFVASDAHSAADYMCFRKAVAKLHTSYDASCGSILNNFGG